MACVFLVRTMRTNKFYERRYISPTIFKMFWVNQAQKRYAMHTRCEMPEPGAVPLLYPAHFTGQNIEWPKPGIKKPNAIRRNIETEKWLYPLGFYCAVRRFSSKEEKRRIVAGVVQPDTFGTAEMLGLENHLNVYHENKHGLPEALARGLAIYLKLYTSTRQPWMKTSAVRVVIPKSMQPTLR